MTTETVKASKQIVLLGAGAGRSARVSQVVRDIAGVDAALHEAGHGTTWIALSTRLADRLVAEAAKLRTPQQRRLGDILFLVMPRPEVLLPARNLFARVAWANDRKHWLPVDDLVEVLSLPDRRRLIVGGMVDRGTGTLTVYRGDLSTITVSLSSFQPTGTGLAPDPGRFAVIDGGQAVRLGKYEATADAIFYEGDPEYRRRLNERRRQAERGFGPSLRRLRLQRRLRQSDFGTVPAKTIARIERGEIVKPQRRTLEAIAGTLGVQPGEIETY